MWASFFPPCSQYSRKAAVLICLFPFLVMLDEIWLSLKKGICAENTLWHPLCQWLSVLAGSCEEVGLQEALFLLLQVQGAFSWPGQACPLTQPPSARAAEAWDESKTAPFTVVQQGPAHLLVADELRTWAPSAHCVHRGSGLSSGVPAGGHCTVPSGVHDGTARAGLPTQTVSAVCTD